MAKAKQQTLEGRVNEVISEVLIREVAEITPNASLVDDLGADSLDIVELVMWLEEKFNLDYQITDEEGEKLRTVADVYELVRNKIR